MSNEIQYDSSYDVPELEIQSGEFSKVGVWRKFEILGVEMKAMLYRSGSYRVALPGREKLVAGDTFEEALYNALTIRETEILSKSGFWYDTSYDVPFPTFHVITLNDSYDTSYDVPQAA